MTFSELATYVEQSFNPPRFTDVQAHRSHEPGCRPEIEFAIHVAASEYEQHDVVYADSIDAVCAKFDARWIRPVGDVDAETGKVDAT